MHETFMSESEDEGGDDTMLGDQSYRYLTVDEMKSLGDDSMPMDTTKDEKMDVSFISNLSAAPPQAPVDQMSPQHQKEQQQYTFTGNFAPDNVDISKTPILAGFLVSFMVDARGGAMRGCRHSGVRVIIPPRKAAAPMRITCRYLKKDKLVHAPPLMEGEALGSRILEMGPSGARFLGPVIIEVPHFASLRGKEREIVILRSDNGETWREHTLEATEEAVQEVLNESFDGEELKQLEDLNTNRITRILTTDFPQYFAIVTRIRQEVHAIGPEGGMVSSTVVPQVQAVFPQGALTKKIKVGLQAQPIPTDLVAKLLGNRVAVSPIVTVEPRRRKFHKPITLTIPVPQAASKGMINQYSGEAPTLRLLCSITGGTTRAQWEDVTGSTPLTFVNDCVSFTTTVSARFWLMDCSNIPEATKMATELYREAIHVPFMSKFVVFSKRHQLEEARVRVFCMTDDREDKTLETQENFVEVSKSRDVEVLEGKPQYLEFAGNVVPVTKSGDQLAFNFYAFRENRLPFTVRVKDQHSDPNGRIAFMKQPKVGRGDPPQTPICNLNIALPDNIQPEPAPSEPDLLALEKKYSFLSISKADTIHKADLRLSDISNMLGSDWVGLAHELDISDSDINLIKSQYPDNVSQQAIVMLRLWMQTSGTNKSITGNALEKGLRKINREDIVTQCIFNVELVTDDIERAMAKAHLDQSGFDAFRDELGPSRDATFIRDVSLDVSYDEQDLMKEAESAEEEEENHKSYPDKIARDQQRVADLSPTYETEEKKYAGEEKVVKENLITDEKVKLEEEMKKKEKVDILDEYALMEEYMANSESVPVVPVINESKVNEIVEGKPISNKDEKTKDEYIEENRIEEINTSKIDNVKANKHVEEKFEDIKFETIKEDKKVEKKPEEVKTEKEQDGKYDFIEQVESVKDIHQEEPSKLSDTTQKASELSEISQEPSINTKISAETVSSSVDGIDSTTITTEQRERITGEDGSIQDCVVVEKITQQEVTVPSEDVQIFQVAKDPLIDGQLQDQIGTTISERTETTTNEDGTVQKSIVIEKITTDLNEKPSVDTELITETISSSIPDKSSSTTERRSFTTSDDGSSVQEHIIIEKRTTSVIDSKETQEDKSEMLQKLGEELGRLDEKLEEKFKEKRKHEEPEVLGGLTAVQEETLVAKSRSQVEPNKPESSQVVVDHLQPSLDGPTTITTNIIKTTISTSNVPDGFTQTSVESSQMSSERGTAEVTSVGETEQGEQHTTMLMGQGTHESTSQSQQVVEQPTALSKDQDNNVFKSKLSEAELAVLDSNILAQKSDVDELAFTNLQRDSMSQEIKTTQEELVSLINEKNIGAQFIMSQESMAIKSTVHKSLENDEVIAKISYSEDVQEEDNCSHLILSSNESNLLSQIVKTQDIQEIISPEQLPQQNIQCTSPSIQSVCSAELKADAGGGGGGGNSEKEFNIQNRENIDKRLDKHNITDVNKRVADVVSSMASTLESITAAAEGFEGGHGSSDEGEEQLMLMRDSPRWEDEEIQADEHEEPRAIKAEIKLLVKTTELGKESIEIRSIREFVEADDSLTCGSGGTMPSSYSDHRVSSSSTGQVTPSGERVYTLQRESIAGQFPSPRFVRLQPSTGSAEGSTHDDFDLMAQVRDVVESGASGAGVHQPRGSSRGPK